FISGRQIALDPVWARDNQPEVRPSLTRFAAICLDVAAHPIGMLRLVTLAEDLAGCAGRKTVLDEAVVGGLVEVDHRIDQRQREPANRADPRDPTGSQREEQHHRKWYHLHHRANDLAGPSATAGEVVQHPLAIAGAKRTAHRVPDPAHRARTTALPVLCC